MSQILKSLARNFRRSPGNTLINLTGLSLGLASGILILLYVFNELSYDRFHENIKELYRVNMVFVNADGSFPSNTIPAAVGPSLKASFPEIASYTRITRPDEGYFLYQGEVFGVKDICYADPGIFQDFSFRLLQGNPAQALGGIFQVVLTESTARAIFGEVNVVGKVLKLNNKDNFQVTAIAQDPPQNSSIRFRALLSFATLYQDPSLHMDWNGGNQYETFIRTAEGISTPGFKKRLNRFLDEQINDQIKSSGGHYTMLFEQLSDIHLQPLSNDGSGGSQGNIRIFSAIAILILAVACFNFTNLSTAGALRRSLETGVRKVSGASRNTLIRQYLGEALVMSLLAFIFALLLIELVQPWYLAVTGIQARVLNPGNLSLVFSVLALVLLTGLAAGAYPAFVLASFSPSVVLKGLNGSLKNSGLIPRILVVVQFAIAAGLINCLLVIYSQMRFIDHSDRGYSAEGVYVLLLPSEAVKKQHTLLGSEIASLPGVESWSAVSEPPGTGLSSNGYFPEGYRDAVLIHVMDTDSGFLNTLNIKLMMGHNFRAGSVSDSSAFLVNESYARRFGLDDPAGHYIQRDGKHPVIGIVRDFHFSTLHDPVEPLIITMQPWGGYSLMLIRTTKTENIADQIEKRWQLLFPGEPFVITPLEAIIGSAYRHEKDFMTLFTGFAMLALLVSCLGLFGLSAVILQQRRRELGIRRILGASPLGLVSGVIGNFSLLVLAGNLIAVVPVMLAMDRWLNRFSYAVSVSPWLFVLTALFTITLANLTIGWQAIKMARLSPLGVIRVR